MNQTRPSDSPLLFTKLSPPVLRKNYVVRTGLFDKLAQSVNMGVTFVQGGAGTGKTTLLSSYIRTSGLKKVGWLSLDASNANAYSFWLYVAAAVDPFLDDDGSLTRLMRSNLDASHMESLLVMLINRLYGEEDYYVVLDDVNYITDITLVHTLEFFINAMPKNLHLFMLSREDPPIYLGPLAVSGRLLFIDGKQMQLSPDEGMAFLKQTLGVAGSDEELDRLNTYAEGWVGGLQLAAAAGVTDERSDILRAGGGIASEYLTREIFESLTQAEQDFLVGTGFLSYFDAGICAGIFDGFTKARFDAMVECLTKKNLFIVCIDEHKGAYRYHNILTEYLQQRFDRQPDEQRRAFHANAAEAFRQAGAREEALKEFCAAGDFDRMLEIAQTMDGDIAAWIHLDKVPLDRLILNPDLAVQCFMYNLGNLNLERCRTMYRMFEEHYQDTDILRAMQFAESYLMEDPAVLPQYRTLSAQQIENLPFGRAVKALTLVQNSIALLQEMRYDEARECVKRALQTCAGANVLVEFFAYNQTAQLYEEIGCLNESLSCYAKSEKLFNSPWMMSGISMNYYVGIVGVYMRQMELDRASEILGYLQELLDREHVHVDVVDMTLAYHLAELKFLKGDAHGGAVCVERILSTYPSFHILNLSRLIHELDCAELLAPAIAERFLVGLEASDDYRSQPFMVLLRARLLFKRGQTEEALERTEDILVFSREHKGKLRLVEAGLLKVFMLVCGPKTADTRREIDNLLREAVYYAHEDKLFMPFFLDRATLLPLMRSLLPRLESEDAPTGAQTAFLRTAIVLCDENASPREQGVLSPRETEVLAQMARGITNRQIAENLYISQATVKTHVLSIFGKLGVSSRMKAVDRGREEGLL